MVLLAGLVVLPVVAAERPGGQTTAYVPPLPGKTFDSMVNLQAKYYGSLKQNQSVAENKLSADLRTLLDPRRIPKGQTKSDIEKMMTSLGQFVPAGGEVPRLDGVKAPGDLVYVTVEMMPGTPTSEIDPFAFSVTGRDEENHHAAAWVEVSRLRALASRKGVRVIHTVMPPVISVTTEGDWIHRTEDVRAFFGYSGEGMKVGIISNGVDHMADALATGDLPANLEVLSNSRGGEEGTAMLEIVYDMVPKAALSFHDCGTDPTQFIHAIKELVDAGCNVICDDVSFDADEPFFEDGEIAQYIENQLSLHQNLIYVSSAGNDAKTHYQGTFFDRGDGLNDFSWGIDPHQNLYAHIPPGGKLDVVLQWNDKWGASGNDYDLYLVNATTGVDLTFPSDNRQSGTGNPVEYIVYENNEPNAVDAALLVRKISGADRILEVVMNPKDKSTVSTDNIVATDSIKGHTAANGVVSVAAIDASDPGNDDIEDFSSRGPVTISYPVATIRNKPDIAGIDGVSITGAGGFGGPSHRFFGTSAAAPHVAAIIAQIWGARPTLTREQILNLLYSRAVDLGTSGWDPVFGNGRANAMVYSPAFFTANPTSGPAPLPVQFTDASNWLDPTGWYWEFGDGSTSTDQNPLYTFNIPGTYSVNFSVTNASGTEWVRRTDFIRVRTKGRIAFQSARDNNGFTEIYVMNADGTGQTRLTNNLAYDIIPSWSPGGLKIAFASYRNGNGEIYVMNADGTGQTRLTNNPADDFMPALSPDGTKIAFASSRVDGFYEIYVMNPDGSGQTRLTNNQVNDFDPAWSPNGTKIAFTSIIENSFNGEIYVMNPDGSGQTRLTNNGYYGGGWDPTWSPDGTKIAFVSFRDGAYDIYVMNADGSGQTRLTNQGSMYDPAWSRDGTKIAFSYSGGEGWHIWVMNADGTGQTRLTLNTGVLSNRWPDWEREQNPTANFTANITSGPAPLTVQFNDTSKWIKPIGWYWEFGDGSTSTEQNPLFTYRIPGTYSVNFWITNASASDWENKTAFIRVTKPVVAPPVADFTASPTSGIAPLTVQFTDTSDCFQCQSWNWDFGDGNTSTEQNPLFTYGIPGTYSVNLRVTNASGSSVASITVTATFPPGAPPAANFTASPTSGVAPLQVQFTDTSDCFQCLEWNWDFGDEKTSTEQNPVFTYWIPGTYSVSLRVTNASGSDWYRTCSESDGGACIEVSAMSAAAKGRIVFTSDRDGNAEIYVMKADGSGQTRLTNNQAIDFEPAWSPSGAKIAFTSMGRDGENIDIYVMNADGSGQTHLTNNASYDAEPAWSPDGARIAFASDRDGNTEIYVMNADGSGQTRLTDNTGWDLTPAWSPDGTKIAFASDRDGNTEIYLMNSDGSGQTRLSNNPTGNDYSPAWSPDGTKIVFVSNRDDNIEIYVMNADGRGQIRLTNDWADDDYPAWSPDGTKIAFASGRDGTTQQIYVMNADGSGQTRLTTNSAQDSEPDWGRAPLPSGQLKWSFKTGGAVESSPAVVGGVVYVGSDDNNIYALNANDGTQKWAFPTGGPVVSSPAVVNGVVYIGSNDGNVYAIDAMTGVKKWSFQSLEPGSSTPYPVTSSPAVSGGIVYIAADSIYALDAGTGDKVWSFPAKGTSSSPAVANGVIYVAGSCSTDADRQCNPVDGAYIYALDAGTGTPKWAFPTANPVLTSPAVEYGIVYTGEGSLGAKGLDALDAGTGKKLWFSPMGSDMASNPVVVDRVVYAGSHDEKLYAFDAETGSLKWTFDTGSSVMSTPAVADGMVYVGSDDPDIYALDAATGHKIWAFPIGSYAGSSPTIENGVVYTGSGDGNVYAIDGSTGNLPPVADAGPDQTVQAGDLVTLSGSGSQDLDGSIVSYAWDFGDTTTGSGETATHSYVAPGTYTVTLMVTDNGGLTGSDTAVITVTASSGKIAFRSARDGNSEIYVMNPDGSNQIDVSNNPASDEYPTWSPDGTKIAFVSGRDGNNEIYVMNADGTGTPTRLTNNPAWDGEPAWSPDGTKIAFTSMGAANFAKIIYVMNADGTNPTRLTPGEFPKWSPDGTKIVFDSNRDGNTEIYVMNADGTYPIRLTNDPAQDWMPAWSPDGSKIAFSSNPVGSIFQIFVMNADGSNLTRLTNTPEYDEYPVWSPDGTKIAFESDRDGNREIYMMDADGTNQTRLTDNPAWDDHPAWGVPPSVMNIPPIAEAGPNQIVHFGDPVSLDGSGSHDLDGSIVSYAWDFGDGSSGSGMTPTHTYTAEGTYTVTLTVTDNGGLTGSDTTAIAVIVISGKIAFESNRDGAIYVMNADGSNPTRLTDSNFVREINPAWSPDGTKIAFCSDKDGEVRIFVKDVYDAKPPTPLTNNLYEELEPAWSPDGTKIAFTCARGVIWPYGTEDICVMYADGDAGGTKPPTLLTNGPAHKQTINPMWENRDPTWSPDGTKIAFSSDRDGNREIYVMGADGSNPTRLTNNLYDDYVPAWSPDGTKIAFTSSGGIYVMNPDGSEQTRLTYNLETSGSDPAWGIAKNLLPVADAGPDRMFQAGETVTLDGSGSHVPAGSILSYAWDFGDGSSGSGMTATHAYTAPGTYTVTLTVTDNWGQTGSDSVVMTVGSPLNLPPVAEAGPDRTIEVGDTVTLDGSGSHDPDGTIVSYTWDFGDATPGSGMTATHTYALFPRTYTVTLTVTDNYGRTGSDTASIQVSVGIPGKFAFTSDRDGNMEIYTMNADGTGTPTRLTDNPGDDVEPAWSPDGTKIAFFRIERDMYPAIYVMNADGSGQTRLMDLHTGTGANPAWSSDGKKIAFKDYSPDGTNTEIYVMNADGTGTPTRLTNTPAEEWNPAWSPGGSTIAFAAHLLGEYYGIRLMDLNGTNPPTQLTNGVDDEPSWSPDGTKIAFRSVLFKNPGLIDTGLKNIFVVDLYGTNQLTQLTNSDINFHPAWSPDGTKIAFIKNDRQFDIYVMNADGTGTPTRLTYTTAQESDLAWGVSNNLAPAAEAGPNQTVKVGDTVTLDGSGSHDLDGSIVSYAWDFGDGSSGSGETTTHTYTASGTFTVTLTVTDNGGLTGSDTAAVTVESPPPQNLPPVANFTANITSGLVPLPVQFTDTSDCFQCLEWYWEFGDGNTSTERNPLFTYGIPGIYPVNLRVTNASGSDWENRTSYITVTAPVPPIAEAGLDRTVQVGGTVTLDGSGSQDSDGSIVSYVWDFGDGSSGFGMTATHSYTAPGTFTVTLTVTDNGGLTGSDTVVVTVESLPPQNLPPVAEAGPDKTVLVGGTVTLDGSGSQDPDGSIVSYAWTFGDTNTGSGVTATHAYTAPGTYTVTLTVTDSGGLTGSDTVVVTVVSPPPQNLPPVADAGPDRTVQVSGTVTLDGSGSHDPDGTIVSYTWAFGDGSSGSGETTTHTYSASGTYTVTLTVTDDDGLTGSDTAVVMVESPPPQNLPPVAEAGPDKTVLVGGIVTLDGSGSHDPDGSIVSYAWDFGDGSSGSGETTTHAYSASGTYTATLMVTDNGGLTGSDTAVVMVESTPPQNLPPDISHAVPSISCLWPPNHKFVDVTIKGVTDPDGDRVTISITKITSDEPTGSGTGSGGKTHEPDASGVGTNTANLRPERAGNGNGRVYVISFTANDGKGGESSGTVKVCVPHDQSDKCIGSDKDTGSDKDKGNDTDKSSDKDNGSNKDQGNDKDTGSNKDQGSDIGKGSDTYKSSNTDKGNDKDKGSNTDKGSDKDKCCCIDDGQKYDATV